MLFTPYQLAIVISATPILMCARYTDYWYASAGASAPASMGGRQ